MQQVGFLQFRPGECQSVGPDASFKIPSWRAPPSMHYAQVSLMYPCKKIHGRQQSVH